MIDEAVLRSKLLGDLAGGRETLTAQLLPSLESSESEPSESEPSDSEPSESDSMARWQINFKHAIAMLKQRFEQLLLQPQLELKALLEKMLRCMGRCRHKPRQGRSYPRISKKPRKKWIVREAQT